MTRDVNDENVVVALGSFNGSLDELRRAQQDYGCFGLPHTLPE